jgi:hypothetical protein
MNDKENFAFCAKGLLPLGINLALIEYTLAPAVRLDRIVAEVRRSMRWLADHLAEYGADPNRLYVAGHRLKPGGRRRPERSSRVAGSGRLLLRRRTRPRFRW